MQQTPPLWQKILTAISYQLSDSFVIPSMTMSISPLPWPIHFLPGNPRLDTLTRGSRFHLDLTRCRAGSVLPLHPPVISGQITNVPTIKGNAPSVDDECSFPFRLPSLPSRSYVPLRRPTLPPLVVRGMWRSSRFLFFTGPAPGTSEAGKAKSRSSTAEPDDCLFLWGDPLCVQFGCLYSPTIHVVESTLCTCSYLHRLYIYFSTSISFSLAKNTHFFIHSPAPNLSTAFTGWSSRSFPVRYIVCHLLLSYKGLCPTFVEWSEEALTWLTDPLYSWKKTDPPPVPVILRLWKNYLERSGESHGKISAQDPARCDPLFIHFSWGPIFFCFQVKKIWRG